jgi:hypothetical protein
MGPFIIYGLVDPDSKEIRYIGRSSSGLARPQKHLLDVKGPPTPKRQWLKTLAPRGYEIVVLEILQKPFEKGSLCWWNLQRNMNALNDAECWWIAFGRASGWQLTNETDGGGGSLNPQKSTREKMSISARARTDDRTKSLETRQKLSRIKKGVPWSKSLRQANKRYWETLPTEVKQERLEFLKKALSKLSPEQRQNNARLGGLAGREKTILNNAKRRGKPLPSSQCINISKGVAAFWAIPENRRNHVALSPDFQAAMTLKKVEYWAERKKTLWKCCCISTRLSL